MGWGEGGRGQGGRWARAANGRGRQMLHFGDGQRAGSRHATAGFCCHALHRHPLRLGHQCAEGRRRQDPGLLSSVSDSNANHGIANQASERPAPLPAARPATGSHRAPHQGRGSPSACKSQRAAVGCLQAGRARQGEAKEGLAEWRRQRERRATQGTEQSARGRGGPRIGLGGMSEDGRDAAMPQARALKAGPQFERSWGCSRCRRSILTLAMCRTCHGDAPPGPAAQRIGGPRLRLAGPGSVASPVSS